MLGRRTRDAIVLRRLLIVFLVVASIGSSVASAVGDALELDAALVRACRGASVAKPILPRMLRADASFPSRLPVFFPCDQVPVRVAGVVVGTIEINTCGAGKLDFADDGEPGEAAFPENAPVLTGGERVRIGPLKGRLQAED